MNAERPTVLILTTHTGGGHLNLSHALQETLAPHYHVVVANPQPSLVEPAYTLATRYGVKFLTWQYNCTDNEMGALWLQRLLTISSLKRLTSIIEQVRPQLIITTHAMIAYATARANERSRRRVPLVFQLTDLGQVHMTWFTEKHADAYLAPTREIFAQAQHQGIEDSRLHLTGRPIRRQFLDASSANREAILTSLGLDPAVFTVFLQGGAKGSARADRTIETLLSMGLPMQVILAAGNNRGMIAHYADAARVRALPFTEEIAPYMAASDVIAGKAGASAISEAFMVERPFLATAFIPGQESSNLSFIEQHDLGWICLDAVTQQKLFAGIASNPEMIAGKVESIRAYKAWNIEANQRIRPVIERLLAPATLA
jgi:UDP-N-acetylglucosamine:LPS N-acetylglucosamine transferase